MFIFTVFGVEYSYDNAPAFVFHALNWLTGTYGTNLDAAPLYARHRGNLLATKWCVPHP